MLPARKTEGETHELAWGASETVTIKVKGYAGLAFGRYFHEIGEWQINNFSGNHTVLEWWPSPKEGTGTRVE